MVDITSNAFHEHLAQEMCSFMLGAMTFVTSLAWNDVFQTLLPQLFPRSAKIYSQVFYAVILTVFSVYFLRLMKTKYKVQA